MSALHARAIFGAAIGAGTINAVIGSETLITFPVLLGLDTAGGQRVQHRAPPCVGGEGLTARADEPVGEARAARAGLVGRGNHGPCAPACLFASAFKAFVPLFIALALILIALQPRLSLALRAGRAQRGAKARASLSVNRIAPGAPSGQGHSLSTNGGAVFVRGDGSS